MKSWFLLVAVLQSFFTHAQQSCIIMGQCRDANTREALEFVQIVLGEGVAHAGSKQAF